MNAYTSGVPATAPGHMSITAAKGLSAAGTLRAMAAITDTNTNYPFNVTGLDIVVYASTFSSAVLNIGFINKEAFYTSNHNISVSDLVITYDPPASRNLFFGSTF